MFIFLCKEKIAHFANFEGLLGLMSENGDCEVKHHLENAPGNGNYTSHQVVQEYVEAFGQYIESSLLNYLNESPYFSIMVDKSTDITTLEEMSICFRWLDYDGVPVEHFLGLVQLNVCDAAAIFGKLKSFLQEKNIDVTRMRGQGYDGAANHDRRKNWCSNKDAITCSKSTLHAL